MINIPYAQIVEKIKEQAKLKEEDIEKKIKVKMDQLAGLISKEGAAHIVANELGVKLVEMTEGKSKIKDIFSGMRSVDVVGRITDVYGLREFSRQDGSAGKVASFRIADESGILRVVLWNDQTDIYEKLKKDRIVFVSGAYVKENRGNLEIHMASKAQITFDPKGEEIGEIAQVKNERKSIGDLKGDETNIELLASVVQMFDPHFYEVCPTCNKRAKQKDGEWSCTEHGKIEPAYSAVLSLTLDDGTGNIRGVFFKNQIASLLKIGVDGIAKLKDNPSDFIDYKDSTIGSMVKVVGRANKNELFSRIEFIAQLVFPNPDPNEEIKRLEEGNKIE